MAKKGQTFQTYTEEFKLNAVRSYVEGSSSTGGLFKKAVSKSSKGEALSQRENDVVGGGSERQSQESMASDAGTIDPIGDSQESEEVQLYAICRTVPLIVI